jgi:hypothetical protein
MAAIKLNTSTNFTTGTASLDICAARPASKAKH